MSCHYAVDIDHGSYKIKEPLITWYYIKGQYESLHYIKSIAPDCYVLFIGYKNADMQPGITGSCEGKESYTKASIRELEEEVGFTCSEFNLQPIDTFKLSPIGTPGNIYILDAKHCSIAKNVQITKKQRSQGAPRKVAVLLYGSKENVKHIAIKGKPIDPEEKIQYYGCIHIDHALEMVSMIKERRIKGIRKEFKYVQ